MTDRDRLARLELIVSESLRKQDRTIEEVMQLKLDVAELNRRVFQPENRMESLEMRVDDLTAVVKMLSEQQATLTDKVSTLQITAEERQRQVNSGLREVLKAIKTSKILVA